MSPVAKAFTVTFAKDRETKGTIRYSEMVKEAVDEPKIGTLYVRKAAAAQLGNPEELTVTVTAK